MFLRDFKYEDLAFQLRKVSNLGPENDCAVEDQTKL
jgi:hypothetical protein